MNLSAKKVVKLHSSRRYNIPKWFQIKLSRLPLVFKSIRVKGARKPSIIKRPVLVAVVMRCGVWFSIFLCRWYYVNVTWHFPSIQMSIEPGLHGVPSTTLAASFAEKRYWESFGLQNREHGWPETGMRIVRKTSIQSVIDELRANNVLQRKPRQPS